MASISKLEYLKRYMSDDSSRNEKKKKRKKLNKSLKTNIRVKIFDDDVDLKSLKTGDLTNTLEDDVGDNDPTIAEIIDERPEHIKNFEKYHQDDRWKRFEESKEVDNGIMYDSDNNQSPKRRQRHDSDNNQSPERRQRHDSDIDESPERRQRHDSDIDESPLRRQRHDSDNDQSPERRQRHDSDNDQSPERRQRHDSDNDQSPTRRQRHDSDSDQSPPRKRNSKSTKISAQKGDDKRKKTQSHDSDSDQSPPRRQKRNSDSDQSPPRKRKHDSDSDQSPPRRENKHSDSDQSPPRKRKPDSHSSRSPHGRTGRREMSNYEKTSNSDKAKRTLSGAKAGLSSAKDVRKETDALRKKHADAFNQIDEDLLGRNAKTVFRDRKTGKRRNMKAEKDEQDIEDAKKREEDAKYELWGKGLKQQSEQDEAVEAAIHEMSKPLARARDDEDLDKMMRDLDRTGDPMAAFITKKKEGKKKARPQYNKPFPPNRFAIRPGYRWDGVDRSNGFEKQYFGKMADRRATNDNAYKWSTEDM